MLTLSCTILYKQKNSKRTSKLTNWEEYRRTLQNNVNLQIKLKCSADLDKVANEFSNIVIEAVRKRKHASK